MNEIRVIGFVILSHENDGKLPRLIRALDDSYGKPPIVVHHDFSQAFFDVADFATNVTFVQPSVPTRWADWSAVDGTLRAFRKLIQDPEVDWAFLLSAADYPIRDGEDVRRELGHCPCDALIDLRPCVPGHRSRARTVGHTSSVMSFMDSAANHELKRRFYMSPQWWIPIVRRKPRWRLGRYTFRPSFDGRHPFTREQAAFYGDHWWGGTRRAIEAVLDEQGFAAKLRRHYRWRTQPDESYYHSVLAARDDLTLCLDNRRFAEWNGGGAHPQILTEADLQPMFASGAFFARKFAADAPVLDAIDAHLAARRMRS